MKFQVTAKSFTDAVSSISKATNKSNSNPLLECIFLQTDDHNLILRASNLEIIAEKNIPIKGEVNGSVLLRSTVFTKLINTFSKSAENLLIERNENILTVSCGEDVFDLDILNEESFPKLPSGITKENNFLQLDKKIFSDSIRSVSFSASTSEIKPEISSVYLYTKDNFLFTVSTDSYRLAEKKIYIENIKNDFSVIIPIKNITNILSILEDSDDNDLVFNPYNDGIIFSLRDLNIAVRTINGTFPDYNQLFPKEFNFNIKINKTEIINALQLTTYIAINYASCNLKSDKEKGVLKITAKESSIGSIKKTIKIETENMENFEDIEVNYNSNYFLEGLQKINNEQIGMNFTTVNKPVFIKSNNDTSFTYLLMPLNR